MVCYVVFVDDLSGNIFICPDEGCMYLILISYDAFSVDNYALGISGL